MAIALARAGTRPLVLERNRDPSDPLCGGFLSWTALERLKNLGIDASDMRAHPITRLALFAGERSAEAELPAPAAAVSRRMLDTTLLAMAEAAGAAVERGVRVRKLDRQGALLADGAVIHGGQHVLATGKHEMPGQRRDGELEDSVLGLRWRLTAPDALANVLAGTIELHCFRGGYAGLVMQENGQANLCLAIRQSRFAEEGKSPDALLTALANEAPALAWRIGASSAVVGPDAIANVPYGWRLTPSSAAPPGLWRLGDQAGVIASLTGEGISLALAGGLKAAEAIRTGAPPETFQADFCKDLHRPLTVAQLLMRAIERPGTAAFAARASALWPPLLRTAARATRLGV